jgi:hypothetical protein
VFNYNMKCTVRSRATPGATPENCRPAVDSTRHLNLGALASLGASLNVGGTRVSVIARWEEMLNDIWPDADAQTKSFTVLGQLYLF